VEKWDIEWKLSFMGEHDYKARNRTTGETMTLHHKISYSDYELSISTEAPEEIFRTLFVLRRSCNLPVPAAVKEAFLDYHKAENERFLAWLAERSHIPAYEADKYGPSCPIIRKAA